jgi:hypothetical protein
MIAEFKHPTGVMATLPRFLTVSLMFPYAYGILVAGERWEAEGNAGLDVLMRDPPLSTTRVLFPEDDDPVEFIGLPREALAAQASARGCEVGFDNVAGALTAKVLFEDYDAAEDLLPLLAAWSGDRFLHVDCGEDSEILWFTRWDDAPSAVQFAERYRAIAPSLAERSGLSDVPSVRVAGRTALVTSGGQLRVARRVGPRRLLPRVPLPEAPARRPAHDPGGRGRGARALAAQDALRRTVEPIRRRAHLAQRHSTFIGTHAPRVRKATDM